MDYKTEVSPGIRSKTTKMTIFPMEEEERIAPQPAMAIETE